MTPIAAVEEIPDRGCRFAYRDGPFEEEGILLRLADGTVRAFKNECRHLPMRLDDRDPADLWDADGRHLVCSSHGARYRPQDGLCVAGPCRGSHLRSLPIVIRDRRVFLDDAKLGGFFNV